MRLHTKNDYCWTASGPATKGSINDACWDFTGRQDSGSEADSTWYYIAAHQGEAGKLADAKAASAGGQRAVINHAADRGASKAQLLRILQREVASTL